MLTIGGDCGFYVEAFELNDWKIIPEKVKYSTDANTQIESQEYIIINYDVKKTGTMTQEFTKAITAFL